MTLSVGGQLLDGPDQLTPRARLVLGFVRGAEEWLEWAVSEPGDAFHFADQAALAEGIQSGLHDTTIVLLPELRLQVDVRRLWQLGLEALEVLASDVRKDGRPTAKQLRMLARHRLRTPEELAKGVKFLSEIGVGSQPVFQAMSLVDRVVVLGLAEASGAASAEAAEFAVSRAVHPIEFVDFYRFYLSVADSLSGDSCAGSRFARAEEVQQILEPFVMAMLRCPVAASDLSPAEAAALAREWLETGRPPGFSRLSQGLREIVGFAGAGMTDAAEARPAVESYTRTLSRLLKGEPDSEQLTQDGSYQQFRWNGEDSSAVLVHSRSTRVLAVDSLEKGQAEASDRKEKR